MEIWMAVISAAVVLGGAWLAILKIRESTRVEDNTKRITALEDERIEACPAGVPVPAAMHGRSWKPLLEGKSDVAWRDSFFYCYFFEHGFATPTTTAVRTQTAKLIKYPGHDDWTELFDLQADPYETKNLATDPAHAELRKSLEAEYEKQSQAIGFRIPDFADVPPADGSLPNPANKSPKKKKTAKKAKE